MTRGGTHERHVAAGQGVATAEKARRVFYEEIGRKGGSADVAARHHEAAPAITRRRLIITGTPAVTCPWRRIGSAAPR
ncbi:MAG TPA: hypothetical protein VMU34_22275 [Mycobacterium sp.]|nr:hypothetical protein [Mycobacterium sp.]